jgi:thiol-disulfide isomerase/thioredoxin
MFTTHRRSLIYALAAGAAVAGVFVSKKHPGVGSSESDPLKALWELNLDLPDGKTLKLQNLRGKPLVLNFWATWCPPCVEELPLFERFYRQNVIKSWQVVAIAADSAKAVNGFLVKMPLSFPTPLAGMAGIELSKTLGNLSGGLPFTVVVNAAGAIVKRHMGKLDAAQIEQIMTLG